MNRKMDGTRRISLRMERMGMDTDTFMVAERDMDTRDSTREMHTETMYKKTPSWLEKWRHAGKSVKII